VCGEPYLGTALAPDSDVPDNGGPARRTQWGVEGESRVSILMRHLVNASLRHDTSERRNYASAGSTVEIIKKGRPVASVRGISI
jgi:hypothetical protein